MLYIGLSQFPWYFIGDFGSKKKKKRFKNMVFSLKKKNSNLDSLATVIVKILAN